MYNGDFKVVTPPTSIFNITVITVKLNDNVHQCVKNQKVVMAKTAA